VHFTESCDTGAPRLITNVETTPATTPDDNMVEVVHRSLACRNLLPSAHLVDKGYTDAKVLVASQREHGVEIIGPVAQDPSWQSRDDAGFDKSAFVVDWEAKVVTCPAGKQSISWLSNTYPKNGTVFEARFARRDCTPCASRSQCTRAKREPRIIGLQTREYHDTLQTMRRRQTTDEFRKAYAARAGIESTHAQAIRRSGLRRTSLSRAAEDSPAACRQRSRYQPASDRCLGERYTLGPDSLLPLRSSTVPIEVISPPVSMLVWA